MNARRFAVVFAASCIACGLSVVGTSGDGVGPNGTDGGGASSGSGILPDGATASGGLEPDGAVPPPPNAPVTIAPAGTATMPSGLAQQTHLIYAENTHRWWLFAISTDAPAVLQSFSSPDFAIWTQAEALPLPQPHRGQGADFSVAYASLNGHDVVHLEIGLLGPSTSHSHDHARAELVDASVKWGSVATIATVNDPALGDPEGAVTYITPGGSIYDLTGWAPYEDVQTQSGNQSAYASSTTDNGTSWTAGFGARSDVDIANRTINARAAIALGGEDLLALWESADNEPNPGTVRSARHNGGLWKAAIDVFGNTPFNVNDWGATTVVTDQIHAVRHTSAFEHSRYSNGDQQWSAGNAIPALDMKLGTGVLVLHDASRVVVFVIGTDEAIHATAWSAAQWSPWKIVVPAAGSRSALSGWWSKTAGFGLIWTDANAVNGWRVAVNN